MVALDIGADRVFELGQILEAKTFREFIANFDLGRGRRALERHLEGGRLAGEPGGAVVIREGHRNRPAFPGLYAFDLRFEAREETARTEDDVNIFARTALEGLAVDFSGEIQRDFVAVFGASLSFLCRVNPLCSASLTKTWSTSAPDTSAISRSISISSKPPASIFGTLRARR